MALAIRCSAVIGATSESHSQSPNESFVAVVSMTTTPPARLYKYQPFNALTLANLKKRVLFFSRVGRFNDPFDGRYQHHARNLSLDELTALVEAFESRIDPAEAHTCRELLRDDPKGLAQRLFPKLPALLDAHLGYRGLCCLTARNDNLLMWGHYADGHRGFCLEFDTAKYPFSRALPVVYQGDFPLFSPADVVLTLDADHMFEVSLRTKSADWYYEEEWRLVHAQADTEFRYSDDSLTGLYFGSEMPSVHKELLALVVMGSPTKLYDVSKSTSSYALTFAQADCPPHPPARGTGG